MMTSCTLLRLFVPIVATMAVATACLGGDDVETLVGEPAETLAFDDAEPADATAPTETADADETETTAGPEGAAGTEPGGAPQVSAPDGPPAPGVAEAEIPCEGGAFPGDDEFREALCAAQYGQILVLRAGGEIDPTWGPRVSQAILGYAQDRDAALAELLAVAAETVEAVTAAGGTPPPAPDAATPADVAAVEAETRDLRSCMVEVGFLIVDANLTAGFDPTEVDAWQERADEIDALVEDGDFAAAEDLVCALRDEIAAAIAAS